MKTYYRTDLAAEALNTAKSHANIEGLDYGEEQLFGLTVQRVDIGSDQAAQFLSKPKGLYFTLQLPQDKGRGGEEFSSTAKAIAELIRRCFGSKPNFSLIAALGNPDITPDAIGPLSASNILVTRHLKEQGSPLFSAFSSVALCRTGVLGTTGLESALQIKNLCAALKPDCVIAIDALAGSRAEGLCRTVQICSSGIAPGSGVKNDRMQLSYESLGVPVVAVGVPTVIDAGSIAGDERLGDMFVTPRDIDSQVRGCARFIGYGINLSLHPGLSIEDVDMLLG